MKEEITVIIHGLQWLQQGFKENEQTTVAIAVMNRLKAFKSNIAKGTQASTMFNSIINGTWPATVREAKEAVASDANEEKGDRRGTIQEPKAGLVSTDAELATFMRQMTTFLETAKIE